MKQLDIPPDTPKGECYRRVREILNDVEVGWTKHQLVEFLGEPDEMRGPEANVSQQFQRLMENVAGGETLIRYGDNTEVDEILVYRDPFRPRRSYGFTIRDGCVYSMWEETRASR